MFATSLISLTPTLLSTTDMAITNGVYYIVNAGTHFGITPANSNDQARQPEAGTKVVTPQTAANRFSVPPATGADASKIRLTQVDPKAYKLESVAEPGVGIAHDHGTNKCASGHTVTMWRKTTTDTWEISNIPGGESNLYIFKVPNKNLYACTDAAGPSVQTDDTTFRIESAANGNFPLCVRLTDDPTSRLAQWFVYAATAK